jgi:hypothetical protein
LDASSHNNRFDTQHQSTCVEHVFLHGNFMELRRRPY